MPIVASRLTAVGNLSISGEFIERSIGSGLTYTTLGPPSPMYIGYTQTWGYYHAGYMSSLRIVKGTAIYTSNFTPTNTFAAVAGTSLLLNVVSSTPDPDTSGNNFPVTYLGGVTVVAGRRSISFNGTTQYLSVPHNSAFKFETGDFTVEWWQYLTVPYTSQNGPAMGAVSNADNYGGWVIYRDNTQNSTKMNFRMTPPTGGGGFRGPDYRECWTSATPATGVWEHWAAVRTGTTFKWYRNGVLDNTYTGIDTNISDTIVSGIPDVTAISLSTTTYKAVMFDEVTLPRIAGAQTGQTDLYSIAFNFNINHLTVADNAALALQLSTLPFVIETWLYLDYDLGWRNDTITSIASKSSSVNYQGWYLYISAVGQNIIFSEASSSPDIIGTTTVPDKTWIHIAVVREGTGANQLKIYLNGVLDATGTSSLNFNQTDLLYIGKNSRLSYTVGELGGKISNFRIVKGYAVYTSDFTPNPPLTVVAGTSLLLNVGSYSTYLKDSSTNNFTVTPGYVGDGGPRFDDYGPKSTSLTTSGLSANSILTGSGGYNYLTVPYSLPLNLTTGNWTIETWFKCTSFTGDQQILNKDGINGYSNSSYGLSISSTGVLTGVIGVGTGAGGQDSYGSYVISLNTWYHVAFVKNVNTIRVFVNGVVNFSGPQLRTMTDGNKPIYIGYQRDQPSSCLFNGYISNLRIVKGAALYASNFAVPTLPLSAIAGTSLLLNVGSASTYLKDSSTNNITIGTVGNPLFIGFDSSGGLVKRETSTGTLLIAGEFDEVSRHQGTSTPISLNSITDENDLALTDENGDALTE